MIKTVENTIYSTNGKLYTGMTKESLRADIDAMTFKSEKAREKAYNKQIEIFNYANSLVENEVDDVISEKEIETYNKKEKTKKTWKTIGIAALGVGLTVGAIILAKKLKIFTNKDYALSKDLELRLNSCKKKQIFEESYNEFIKSKNLHIKHEIIPIINEGDMLHGMEYDSKAVSSVLENGILSGEVAFKGKRVYSDGVLLKDKLAIIPEDSETFGCADFFTSPKKMSIGEYFSSFVNRKMGIRKAPECSYLPRTISVGSGGRQIAFIVDAKKFKESCPTLHKNSATPAFLKDSPLAGIIDHFVNYDNLRSVLVGVPPNCISKIVVDVGIKPEEIENIKNIIKRLKLNISIYDVLGNLL